ncbi:hypothetical protein ACXR0O_05000 [Verrucomicrobiota bacterium sgz303538]
MKSHLIKLLLAIALFCPALAWAADLATEDGFKAAYQQAIEQKDLKQLEALVYWDRVPERFKGLWHQRQEEQFGLKILSIELTSGASAEFPKEFTLEGVTYKPNLEVSHTLTIVFGENAFGAKQTSMIPVGRKDGRLYVVSTAPVAK